MTVERADFLKTIGDRLKNSPIVSLLGPRQSGKTTLARTFAGGFPGSVHFFDLESPQDQARLANPELMLRPLTGLVVLDEVQRNPELFPLLRVLADRPNIPARFLILGSAAPELIRDASESLAGRVSFVDINGFSLSETGNANWSDLWWRGGFPRAYLAPSDRVAHQWMTDFQRTFLERDIPQLGIMIPAATLGRFWTMVAHYHGTVLNLAELARALGSSEPTARRYLDILYGTFMVRPLSPWFTNLKKRQIRSPKIYLRDSGLLHHLLGIPDMRSLYAHPKVGASWEGFCVEQILSVSRQSTGYFWGTQSGAELDLLLPHSGKQIGIEIKFTERPVVTRSMRIAIQDLRLDHLFLVHPGDQEFPLDQSITAIPITNLVQKLRKGPAQK